MIYIMNCMKPSTIKHMLKVFIIPSMLVFYKKTHIHLMSHTYLDDITNIHIWFVYMDSLYDPIASSHLSKSGHLRPSSKSGAHLPWASYHLVESWQNHVSHPSVITYQTHLDHVLLELVIYQQPFVESVHVPFLEKHVFCGTWLNSSSTSLTVASFFEDQGYLISFWLTKLFHDFFEKNYLI